MADSFGNLVVRTHAPKRRAVLLGAAVLLALGVLYAAFEVGRYDAGFRVVDSVRGALSASARIRSLEKENEEARVEREAGQCGGGQRRHHGRWAGTGEAVQLEFRPSRA